MSQHPTRWKRSYRESNGAEESYSAPVILILQVGPIAPPHHLHKDHIVSSQEQRLSHIKLCWQP